MLRESERVTVYVVLAVEIDMCEMTAIRVFFGFGDFHLFTVCARIVDKGTHTHTHTRYTRDTHEIVRGYCETARLLRD